MLVGFKYNRDIKEHKRTIYGPLDFLGDVGGLSGILEDIGGIFMVLLHLITGNPYTTYLLTNIFQKDNSHKNVNLTST